MYGSPMGVARGTIEPRRCADPEPPIGIALRNNPLCRFNGGSTRKH